ncbi:hypothetical protein JQ615_41405 [Bradyrhizobium jicamae]|uniref:Uncharacterized protein n=1 Tax=Bradyrhizobium jicamae TaxID=280332 RepID=A0ABS5G019_9BRAD|nr:hypothetical protein [Bradyrhizobium jicamae]MBR0801796.1 hypothetical protein [Bradyrhizobium jicamae]
MDQVDKAGYVTFLVASLLGMSQTSAGVDEAVIRLSYVEVHDRIRPSPEVTSTSVNVLLHLRSGGTVMHVEDRASGSARGAGKSDLRLGRDGPRGWHVAGPHDLVNIQKYYTYSRAIRVTVEGSSCTAKIGYALNPGATDYQYTRLLNGDRATARSVKASNVICSIQQMGAP